MAVLQTVATFALFLSLSSAVTLTCNNLLTPLPLENYDELTGKWVILALAGERQLPELESSWIEILADDQGTLKTVYWADKLNTRCVTGSSDITFSGGVSNTIVNSKVNKGKYLQTCAGCFLYAKISDDDTISNHMFLAKREGSVLEESEKEAFRKQAECVNLPQITYLQTGGADLCPDDRTQQ